MKALGLEMMTMAGNPPREIKSLIDNHIEGFNNQNIELFSAFLRTPPLSLMGLHLSLVEPECPRQLACRRRKVA